MVDVRVRGWARLGGVLLVASAGGDACAQFFTPEGTTWASGKYLVDETPLATIEAGDVLTYGPVPTGVAIRRGGRVLEDTKKQDMVSPTGELRVLYRGEEGPRYDEISRPTFSSQGHDIGYIARKGNAWYAVIDGAATELPAPRGTVVGSLGPEIVFSPDGERWAARIGYFIGGEEGGAWNENHLIVDGQLVERVAWEMFPDDQDGADVIPDARDLIERDRDAEEAEEYDEEGPGEEVDSLFASMGSQGIQGVKFSPDGKQVAYVVDVNRGATARFGDAEAGPSTGCYVAVDGKAGARYLEIDPESLQFLPRGQGTAYLAESDDGWSVVLGGRATPPAPRRLRNLVLSPAGGRYAVTLALREKPRFETTELVLYVRGPGGAEEAGPFETIEQVQFSADGKEFAAVGTRGDKATLIFTADGKREDKELKSVGEVQFNPTGKGMAWAAETLEGQHVVSTIAAAVGDSPARELTFSPDGKEAAYVLATAEGDVLYRGKEKVAAARRIANLTYSNGGRLAYTVQEVAGGPMAAALEGETLERADVVGEGPGQVLWFDGEGRLRYLARRGNELLGESVPPL